MLNLLIHHPRHRLRPLRFIIAIISSLSTVITAYVIGLIVILTYSAIMIILSLTVIITYTNTTTTSTTATITKNISLIIIITTTATITLVIIINIITTIIFFLWYQPPRWPSGKASASRAEDPGFESRLRRDVFGVESYQ